MKYKHLTLKQRYEIKVYIKCNKSQKFVTKQLGVSESTISRELKRNRLKRRDIPLKTLRNKPIFAKKYFSKEEKFDRRMILF